jgi:2-hydroxy-3-keto-5-methylthiopentenyl-1-phosphate phosphatase
MTRPVGACSGDDPVDDAAAGSHSRSRALLPAASPTSTVPSLTAGAVPIPQLLPGQPPLAILVDYDGTIARTDVSDALMAAFVNAEWEDRVAEYDAGRVGSRGLIEWEFGLITADPTALGALAAAQPHDSAFRSFVDVARAAGIPVEVVSDGFGFFIAPALEALGVGDLPVATAHATFDGGPRIEFPNGNPACLVCGTCKRNRVLAHQAAGRAVAFVGDGPSDRYAAGYADIVFAKDALVQICVDAGWPFRRWAEFTEIRAWLERKVAAFVADPGSLPVPRPARLFCGAEVWGPGRRDPAPARAEP